MDQIVKQQSFRIAIIAAVITASLYFYMYATSDYLNSTFSLLFYTIPGIAGVIAQLVSKFKLAGTISFKQAVMAYVIVIVAVFIAEALSAYSIMNHLDSNGKTVLLEAWDKVYNSQANELATESMFKKPTFSAGEYVQGIFTKTIIYTVFGLISGLIISKANPPKA